MRISDDQNGNKGVRIEPDQVLQHAIGELEHVAVVGFDKSGKLYKASSSPNVCEVIGLLDFAKCALYDGFKDEEEE
jgi:hypothetical protein